MMELQALFDDYDGFIVDLWGVVHDGTMLYPGATETLAYLHDCYKPVVFLSNAPRLSVKAIATLDRLGVPKEYYRAVVTSGQVAHDSLQAKQEFARYYYLGPGKDEDIIADLSNYERVDDPAKADFVLNTGYEVDFQPHEEIIPVLEKLRSHKLPLICVNPDVEVVKQDGTAMLCAGSVAAEYEKRGGNVHYFGKPHPEVYETCKSLLKVPRILAIGDNPDTDIAGARRMGFDSILITGGILKHRSDFSSGGATYVLPAFQLT